MTRSRHFDAEQPGAAALDLGPLPEWDLSDLYTAPDAPEIKADLARLEEATASFAADYEGRLAGLDAVPEAMLADLDANWEVLAEAIQTVVRAEIVAGRSQITDPYALLKELTRGRRVGGPELAEFVRGLDIGDEAKERLLALTPAGYIGLSDALVDEV